MIEWKPLHKDLGEYLAERRKTAGFSQKEVAQMAGLKNSQFISNIERGIASPPKELLCLFMALYKLNKKELIKKILGVIEKELQQGLKPSLKKRSKSKSHTRSITFKSSS